MKRIMIVTAALVFMVSGFASSEESAGAGLYNGITYFDAGVETNCADPGSLTAGNSGSIEADRKIFNGITFFDAGTAGSAPRGKCAGSSSTLASAEKIFNGITVF